MQDYYNICVCMNKKDSERGEMDLQNFPKASVIISAFRKFPFTLTFLVNRCAPWRSKDRPLTFATKICLMAFLLLLLGEGNTAKLEQEVPFQSVLCNPVHSHVQSS